jgi:hypothetical protein
MTGSILKLEPYGPIISTFSQKATADRLYESIRKEEKRKSQK